MVWDLEWGTPERQKFLKIGAIPLSEIAAYFELFEVHDPDERHAYVTMIKALDSAYLERTNKASTASVKPVEPRKKVAVDG